MSASADVQVQHHPALDEWRVSPALQELEAEWEHAACCAEAHYPGAPQPAEPLPFNPDEWWPESCD